MLAYPPKVAAGTTLPVCLVLHGLRRRRARPVRRARLPPAAGRRRRGRRAAVRARLRRRRATATGIPAASGDDPLAMLLADFPVVLAQHGLPVDRVRPARLVHGRLRRAARRHRGAGAVRRRRRQRARPLAARTTTPSRSTRAPSTRPRSGGTWGDLRTRTGAAQGRHGCASTAASPTVRPGAVVAAGAAARPGRRCTSRQGCHDDDVLALGRARAAQLIGEALTPPPLQYARGTSRSPLGPKSDVIRRTARPPGLEPGTFAPKAKVLPITPRPIASPA